MTIAPPPKPILPIRLPGLPGDKPLIPKKSELTGLGPSDFPQCGENLENDDRFILVSGDDDD